MSRGHGTRERALLEQLKTGPRLEHELQWLALNPDGSDLEDDTNVKCGPRFPALRIKTSAFNAFRRALNNLETAGKVRSRSLGKVTDDALLLRWFPFHTQSLALKQFRELVLPHYFCFLDETHAQFLANQSEEHAVAQIDASLKQTFWERWCAEVVPALNKLILRPEHYLTAIALSARGIQLLQPPTTFAARMLRFHWSVSVTGALSPIAERLGADQPSSLRSFIVDMSTAIGAAHVAYKSRLYSGLVLSGTSQLKADAAHYLYMCKELTPIFEQFPDFERPSVGGFMVRNERNVGSFVHKLFSNRVFDEIKEYSLAE